MPKADLTFIRGDRKSNLDYRDNLPVNMYAVRRNIDGDDGYMLSHDGLTEFASVSGAGRGGTYNERFNEHYRVSGNAFESVGADGSVAVLGNITGQSPVSFANSFNTQCAVSDGKAYLYDTVSLRQIVDPDIGFPIDVTWFRGVYVFTDGESLYHTDLSDEFSISSLAYSSSEFAADPIKAVKRNDQNQIIAFNRYSVEYFTFNPNVPIGSSLLQVVNGKGVKIGIVGTKCVTELDGNFYILGGRKKESPTIQAFSGGRAVPVATREVDKLIAKYSESELSGVVLESRVVDRDNFLVVHLPNETLLYNLTIAKVVGNDVAWSYVKTDVNTDEPWRGKFGVFDPRISKWIYGDIKENKLAYLDNESGAQYGEQQEFILYSPIVPLEQASINEFEIDTISGFTPSELDSEERAAFSMSYNGVTYGTEYWNSISKQGDYDVRYIARRLGYIRDSFNFKFRFVSVNKMALSRLVVDYG
jgi:hypothetical protein